MNGIWYGKQPLGLNQQSFHDMRKYEEASQPSLLTIDLFSVYIQRWSRARMQRQPSLPSCQGCPRPGWNWAGLHHPEGHQPHSPDRSQHVSRWDDLSTAMRFNQIYLAKIQQVWFQLESKFLNDEWSLLNFDRNLRLNTVRVKYILLNSFSSNPNYNWTIIEWFIQKWCFFLE